MERRPKAIQPGTGIVQQPAQQEWTQVGRSRDPQPSAESGQLLTPVSNCSEVLQEIDNVKQEEAMYMNGNIGMGGTTNPNG